MSDRPTPLETLRAEDVRRWARPFVYAWRRGDRVLYVGATRRGLPRLQGAHRAIAVGGGMQPGDVFDLYRVPRGVPIGDFERQVIAALTPELNGKTDRLYFERDRRRDKVRHRYPIEHFRNDVVEDVEG